MPNYSKYSTARLLKSLAREKKMWHSLPRKSSFSGLAVSGRLEKIQTILENREAKFEPIYTEINMLG
jgi:hypothetical protein